MIESKVYERDRALFESLKTLTEEDRKALAVAVVPFNTRAASAIRRMGITTLGQLQQCTEHELLGQPGMGDLSCQQTAFYMAELGLPLRGTVSASAAGSNSETAAQIIDQIRSLIDKLEVLHAGL